MSTQLETFYDENTATLTYVVFEPEKKIGIIIDPVHDYNQASSTLSRESIDHLLNFIKIKDLKIPYILETHAHADHLTGAWLLKEILGDVQIGIGAHITSVQKVFKDIYNLKDLKTDASQFDFLLNEQTKLDVMGAFEVQTIFTPGHTPACASYLIEDRLFTGDALFIPDFGTGRCDFPSGSAKDLYHSVHEKLYKLPDSTRYYPGHDYKPNGRPLRFEATIGESKKDNIQLKESTSESEFVEFRQERDKKLNAPKLLLPSIQVNIQAGKIPEPEDNNVSYLKLPITNKEIV